MERRRIAVITARADESEQSLTLKGIAAAALSKNIDVIVFSNRYNYWDDDSTLTYENVIYDLFTAELFDGVILMTEPFMSVDVIGSVISKIKASGIPTIVIGDKTSGLPVMEWDDDKDMAKITEHLITVHGFTEFDILTGPESNPISHNRIKGCIDECKRHGITVSDTSIVYGNFWTDSGYELGMEYLRGERRLPQAVICASDNMAHGLCSALENSHIKIPDDLTVTGYDRSSQKLMHYSLFTSCERRRYDMGIRGVKLLFPDVDLPESDGTDIILGDTCPCGVDHKKLGDELRYASIQQYHMIGYFMSEFSSKLTLCRTLAEYTGVMQDFFHLLHDAENLHIILDKTWSDGEFSGKDFYRYKVNRRNVEFRPHTSSELQIVSELLSEEKTAKLYYFSPLCFQTECFGYTALQYSQPDCYDFSFRDFSKTAANALELLRMKNNIHYLKQCRQLSALYDRLTEFYTINEFRKILSISAGQDSEKSKLYIVHLGFPENAEYKYGDNYRNDIISAAAKAVRAAGKQEDIYCRGSDNVLFVLRKKDDDLFYTKLRVILHHELTAMEQAEMAVFTCIKSDTKPDLAALDLLFEEGKKQCDEILRFRALRQNLPHYSDFQALHRRVHLTPKSAPASESACKELCISGGYFRTAYQKCMDVTYSQDCINARISMACYLLCTTVMSVYSIAVQTGYKNEKYLARQFRQLIGTSPSKFRELCG